jgi:predicted PurR-regulated permease PerM
MSVSGRTPRLHVAYRAVLLAAALVVAGLIFRQIVTLLVAITITVIWAIPLSVAAGRLERRGLPRAVGALLALLAVGVMLTGLLMAVIPPFVEQVNTLVNSVPAIVDDLRRQISESTGTSSAEIGRRVQAFLRRYTERPLLLLGPVASLGAGLASVVAAFVLMVMTAYYIAVRPQPLVSAIVRLFPPGSRRHALEVMGRLREAWVGWLRGVVVDMVISGVLLYAGLRLVGLDFAVVFAVLGALLVVIPYFGAILGGLPPVLFALTDSPGRALLVMVVYVVVQQVEGNLIIPLVMSRAVKLHPAAIAVGVVVVGAVFGFVGLFVAVPILSTVTILTEELWVRPLEEPVPR